MTLSQPNEINKYIPKLKLNILLGTSNVGRDTLITRVLQELDPHYDAIIRRSTTRQKRFTDKYLNFVTKENFISKISNKEMLCYVLYPPNQQYYGVDIKEITKIKDLSNPYIMESTYVGLFMKKAFIKSNLILILPESIEQIISHINKKNEPTTEKELRLDNIISLFNYMKKHAPELYKRGYIDSVIVNKENAIKQAGKKILSIINSDKRFYELT